MYMYFFSLKLRRIDPAVEESAITFDLYGQENKTWERYLKVLSVKGSVLTMISLLFCMIYSYINSLLCNYSVWADAASKNVNLYVAAILKSLTCREHIMFSCFISRFERPFITFKSFFFVLSLLEYFILLITIKKDRHLLSHFRKVTFLPIIYLIKSFVYF